MASDVQRWAESEARQAEAIARAERDALDAEVSALRAALERIDRFAKVPWSGPYCRWCGWVDERHRPTCPTAIARDALGRYPKEASDG